MKQIAAAKFKEQCLALLEDVDPDGIVITKRGKPVARLVPFSTDSATLIGSLARKIQIKGNILSTGIEWDAQPRHAGSRALEVEAGAARAVTRAHPKTSFKRR